MDVLKRTRELPAQSAVDVVRGMAVRRTKGGIPVVRLHYSGIPERDPESNPAWKEEERKSYTSQAAWDREQEIVDEAGGGELVFADTLITYWNKIVITDPAWRPSPNWKPLGGFDHGKTNPTALEKAYVDYDGVQYFCGEYYMPGKEIWENAPQIMRLPDIGRMDACWADPTIFDFNVQQSQSGAAKERAKSLNQLYCEQGVNLFSPFALDRSDISFASRVMMHWANLEKREPTLKIVCRNFSEHPQPGLHPWDCPNLLWELMRTRRIKLSAQQLLSRNLAEAIVDKDNHGRDAMKYLVMSLPEPTVKTLQQIAREAVQEQNLDPTSAMIRYTDMMAAGEQGGGPARLGRRRR